MAKKYILKLTAEERADLARLAREGDVAGWKARRARALLKCDQGPDLAHRWNRRSGVSKGPKRAGRSAQGAPVRAIQRTASSESRPPLAMAP